MCNEHLFQDETARLALRALAVKPDPQDRRDNKAHALSKEQQAHQEPRDFPVRLAHQAVSGRRVNQDQQARLA